MDFEELLRKIKKNHESTENKLSGPPTSANLSPEVRFDPMRAAQVELQYQ